MKGENFQISSLSGQTYRAVPAEERRAIGITDGLVRLSVGVEAARDLISDLGQALQF